MADGERVPAYDISWPQCPSNMPAGEFEFAVIGLNNGRPFTDNECFWAQYEWARKAEPNPAVYVNVDFPRAGRPEALSGPYGKCAETDDWCRGYNWGYNLAKDSVGRAERWRIDPEMFWLDVEVDNHWSASTRNNSQVVRGALDYMREHNVPTGIYGTKYQWGLLIGDFQASWMIPLWIAGAVDAADAERRCDDNTKFAFAGGIIWLSQYYPEGVWDGNVKCPAAATGGRENAAATKGVTGQAQATATASQQKGSGTQEPAPAADAQPPTGTPATPEMHPVLPKVLSLWTWIAPLARD